VFLLLAKLRHIRSCIILVLPKNVFKAKTAKYQSAGFCVCFDASRVQTSLALNCSFWIVALTLCHLSCMSSHCRPWPMTCWASRTTSTGKASALCSGGVTLSFYSCLLITSFFLTHVFFKVLFLIIACSFWLQGRSKAMYALTKKLKLTAHWHSFTSI